jgi:hypothetical protein
MISAADEAFQRALTAMQAARPSAAEAFLSKFRNRN